MFVAFGNARPEHHARGALFHAAIASDGNAARAVGARNHLPPGTAAELAIFERHLAVARIRAPSPDRKALRLWKGVERLAAAADGARRDADNGVAGVMRLRARGDARKLLLHDGSELVHLVFHLDHFFAHVENDFDAGEIDTHVASQSQNHIEPLEVGIGVEAGIALRAGGLQEANALVKPQGLRVQLVQLGHGADHVAGSGVFFAFRRHKPISPFNWAARQTPALLKSALRGSAGATCSNSFIRLRTRSSVGSGTMISISTYSSPRAPVRGFGTPFSRRRSVRPELVEGGMRTTERPSIVGTSTFAPSVASLTVTGSLT